MVVRLVSAGVAVLVAVAMGLFTYVIATGRIPGEMVELSYLVSNYGFYLIPLGLFGAGLSALLAQRRMARGLRVVGVGTAAVCLIGVAAAMFPVVSSYRSADRYEAKLSVLDYVTGGSNAGRPVESLSTIYNTVDGTALLLDAKVPMGGPSGARPAVVWVHGGGWAHGDRGEAPKWHKWLNDKGYAVFAIEYRMSPPPRWDQAAADVKCAIGWVKQHALEYTIDPERVMVAGGSAGGNLALMAAYADPIAPSCAVADASVRAVAAFYPATDLAAAWRDPRLLPEIRDLVEDYTGGTPAQVPSHYAAASPINYVRPGLPPTLIMHGTRDHVVPYEQSVALIDRLDDAGVPNELLPAPYGEHAYDFTWGDWSTQISRQVFADFLDQRLPARKP
ncbi:alpha/beta hydrolase fold domain-containing protein [Nocardia sp. IFM 10818]